MAVFVLSNVALAHPGSTDADGGHYDHSTGEYHYHHGYPAHQHYDMDGDGIPDCPYDFDDKTGQNSGGSSSSNSKTSNNYKSATELERKQTEREEYERKNGLGEYHTAYIIKHIVLHGSLTTVAVVINKAFF